MLNDLELTGRARTHVVPCGDGRIALHPEAAAAFGYLQAAAAREGLALEAVSAFRDFETQLRIWNRKFRGELPLLDDAGRVLERASLDDAAAVGAILRWSALPGASRHHWGSDADIVDAAAVRAGYRVQLVVSEFEPGGVFQQAGEWLEANAARFGFFRPYRDALGGVAPEPWHWSFAPVSEPALRAMSPGLLAAALATADLEGRDAVTPRLGQIFALHVLGVSAPPDSLLA